MAFIFNNLLQSPLKGIARGTQNFLGDQGPFLLQFGLRIFERIMRNSACLALEDGPHRKVQRIQVSLRCWWTPGCGNVSTVGSFLSHARALSLAERSNVLSQSAPWTFQQDSSPSHGSRMTQRWIQAHIPAFISKEDWPSKSSDLNLLDFSVWSILEGKACRTSYDSLENLKAKLQREWALISQEVLCAWCNTLQGRQKQIIKNIGSHIEKMID